MTQAPCDTFPHLARRKEEPAGLIAKCEYAEVWIFIRR